MTDRGFLESGVSLADGFARIEAAIHGMGVLPGALKVLDAWAIELLKNAAHHETLSQLMALREVMVDLPAWSESSRARQQQNAQSRIDPLRLRLTAIQVATE
jgi:hypothetical protein